MYVDFMRIMEKVVIYIYMYEIMFSFVFSFIVNDFIEVI